jgi:hypothetical protein
VCRRRAVRVDEGDLPHLASLVGREKLVERLARVTALREQREAARTVAALRERLGGDGADPGLGPRARRPGVERA